MGNILINLNVTPKGLDNFYGNILPIMNFRDPRIFMKATIIGDIPGIDTFYRDFPNLELHQVFVNPPSYDKITNRQGRIGNLMDYRFNEKFSSMFLMDDDMEIIDPELFIRSLKKMDEIIERFSLAFLKTTTHPDPAANCIQSNIGWPWMANGMMIRWYEFQCPKHLMDKWFFLDDFIIFKDAAEQFNYKFAQYNYPIGLIHHTTTDAHKKGIVVDEQVCSYLSDGRIRDHQTFDQEFIKLYSEYFNSLNKF